MESIKSGIPPRSIRPSPYGRNVPESFGFGPNKRPLSGSKLPQSTRSNSALERNEGSIENLPLSSNTSKNRPSKLQALGSSSVRCVGRNNISPTSASTGIPQRFKECNKSSPTDVNVLEPNLDAINSNLIKCNMKHSLITNDNNNLECGLTCNSKLVNTQNKDREQVSENSEQLTIKSVSDKISSNSNTKCNFYKVEDNLNTSIDKEVEMKNLIKKSGLPTRISHKPSKLPSFVSGLREPLDQQDEERLPVPSEQLQTKIPVHSTAKKEKHNDGSYVVSDSDERLNRVGDYKTERNKRFSSLSHSQLVDRDFGVGSAFSECERLEGSNALRDGECFSSFEGSSISRRNKEPSVSSNRVKLRDSSEDIQNSYSVSSRIPSSFRQNKNQGNTFTFKHERKEDELQQLNKANRNELSQSYGSVRGILTYSKIPSMKNGDETSKAAWKKVYDTKIQNAKRLQISNGYSNIPKTRYTIPKLDKGISKQIQVKHFTVTSEDKDSDTQLAQVSRTIKCSSPFHASVSEDGQMITGNQLSQETTDSTFEDQGCFSPTCDSDNRDFLIDDEIEDQPGLMAFENEKDFSGGMTSLQQSVTELTELQAANQSRYRGSNTFYFGDSLKSCSDIGSSCSSLASDDLILVEEGDEKLISESTVIRRHHKRNTQNIDVDSSPINESSLKHQLGWRLRSISQPPFVSSHLLSSESDEGSIKLDAPAYKLICQDVNSLKTNLLHLKNILHEAETLNPFEISTAENVFYLNLVNNDLPSEYLVRNEVDKSSPEVPFSRDINSVSQENIDLRRLVVLLQEQLEERDYLVRSLQQQLSECTFPKNKSENRLQENTCNAATQTERVRSWTSSQNETGTCEDVTHPSSLVSSRKKLSPQGVRSQDPQSHKEKKSTGVKKSHSTKPILPSS